MPATVTAIAIAAEAFAAGYVGVGAISTAVYFGTQGAIYGGVMLGINAGMAALMKPSTGAAGSPNFGSDKIFNTSSTIYPIPIGYGQFKMGGNILRRHVFGASDRRMHLIIGLCKGVIESISNPDLNDVPWDEMTHGVGYDEVEKYYGATTEMLSSRFMEASVTGSWVGDTFTRTSGRLFKTTDVNSYFVITSPAVSTAYYKILSRTSADIIVCDRSGAGTVGYVDRSKKMAATQGTWSGGGTIFTRTKGRRFKASDVGSWFETASGEWQVTEVDVADQWIVCDTAGAGAGSPGYLEDTGWSQAYRGLAYIVLQLKATAKLGGNVNTTVIIEGKKCTPLAEL